MIAILQHDEAEAGKQPSAKMKSMASRLNHNLYIVSGGPGSGKTTVLRKLSARQIIREQVQTGGTALPWGDREAYIALMLQRSIEAFQEHTPASGPMFSDRGIPDTLAYARSIGLRQVQRVESACRLYRCAPLMFFAPPWREIDAVYRACGYQTVELPTSEPSARTQFILEHIPLGK